MNDLSSMTYEKWPVTNGICHWSLAISHMSSSQSFMEALGCSGRRTDLVVPAANGCSVFKLCGDETDSRFAVAHGIQPHGHLGACRNRRCTIAHTPQLLRATSLGCS